MAGSFVPSPSLRGLFWGVDGISLIIASALLTLHYFRRGNDLVAAGFLVFLAGQTLIVSCSAMSLEHAEPFFAAGTGLWAAALALISAPRTMPAWNRVLGAFAAMLFAVVALHGFMNFPLTPLSRPVPFFAYPFLVATLLGWAWVYSREV